MWKRVPPPASPVMHVHCLGHQLRVPFPQLGTSLHIGEHQGDGLAQAALPGGQLLGRQGAVGARAPRINTRTPTARMTAPYQGRPEERISGFCGGAQF